MKNFVSPHCHIQSLDSASTPKTFAKRELELGTGHITCTDHGTLEATRTVYDLCAPGGKYHGKLTPILGLEGYFRDDNDPYLLAKGIPRKQLSDGRLSYVDYYKYCHITLHALDEAAYFALVKKISDADFRAEKHGSERKPLFDWAALEDLGSYNITGTSGCLIGMVGRHLLANDDPATAIHFYERTRSLFKPGNFFVELFPHCTDQYFQSAVKVTLEDGTVHDFKSTRKLRTASSIDNGEIYAEDLAAEFKKDANSARKRHVSILDVMENRKWTGRQLLNIRSVQLHEGFVQNECKPWCDHSDYQLEVNRFVAALAKKYGDPILVSDDAHFAYPEEKVLQDVKLDNWRFANSHHRMTSQEAFSYFRDRLSVSEATFQGWVQNSHDWAGRFKDFKFSPRQALPAKFYPTDTLRHTFELIQKHRRMNWNDPVMTARLKQEIDLLHRNGTVDLLPYFMVDEEVCWLYRKKGYLTGPGRGSAAGLLLAYLLGITHNNPLVNDLSVDRFMTIDRVKSGKLPDIDQDLPFRGLLVDENDPTKGWLAERFGDHVSQMSVDISLKLKMAIKDVHRHIDGEVKDEIEEICKKLPNPPQGIDSRDFVFGYEIDGVYTPGLVETDKVLQNYIAAYPKYWDLVKGLIGLPKAKGRHPCGFVISSQPIDTFVPMTTVGDVRCTALTANSVEAMGGLKMDFLTVNSIGDIDRALRLIQRRHAPDLLPDGENVVYRQIDDQYVATVQILPHKGGYVDIYNLPADTDVFKEICKGRVETVFQLDGAAARRGLKEFPIIDDKPTLSSLEDLAAFTALDRPGPLDAYVQNDDGTQHNMLVEFANRAKGGPGVGRTKTLDELCSKTLGVIVYQEQLQNIFKEVGGTTGIEANNFRQRIGKKKLQEVQRLDKPLFMKGAYEKLSKEEADRLWEMMETFGQYGFNKSHAICYMNVAYACAFLKYHYPLEWWTSVLTNAERKDVDDKFWRYCGPLILLPDVTKSTSSFEIEGDKIRAPVWLIHGIGEKAHNLLSSITASGVSSLEELLTKIQDYRKANSTVVTKKNKAGETVQATRIGHNPLNDSIMRKMIVCGVMDSLFPKEKDGLPLDIIDKLSIFDMTAAKVRGVKKIKPAAGNFASISNAAKFQYIKSILPAYSASLMPILRETTPDRVSVAGSDMVYYVQGKERYSVVAGDQFDWLENLEYLPTETLKVAIPAYVQSQRVFSYPKKNPTKTACELVLDIDGHRKSYVKWALKDDQLTKFKQPLEGAIVVGMFTRRKGSEDFFFQDIDVIVAPPSNDKEETSE